MDWTLGTGKVSAFASVVLGVLLGLLIVTVGVFLGLSIVTVTNDHERVQSIEKRVEKLEGMKK
jgi:hypothetical protein